MVVSETDPVAQMALPPGFRFFPTDEELMVQYLCRKVAGHHFKLQIIGEIDLYKFDPWVLPGKAIFGEKEWYFFSPRDRKYPNGSRPNRVAGTGYWKATGTDKIISTGGRKVGIKKALVFYVGKAPNGRKTNWIMHEYRLLETSRKIGSSKLDDWVLCRIYEKNFRSSQKQITASISGKECSNGSPSSSSEFGDLLESLPEIEDRILSMQDDQILNFQSHSGGNFDWESLGGLNSPLELASPFNQTQQIAQGINGSFNDIIIPQLLHSEYSPVKCASNSVQDEVLSGFRTPRVDNSALFQPNSLLNSSLNSVDPYGFGYPTHYGEFEFGQ